jgi:surfactin synthase thioesterase subunit
VLNRWLPDILPDAAVRCRVFCFPHAGGSAAAYQPLRALSPRWLEFLPVELPGRGARFTEPPFSRMEPLVGALQDMLRPVLDQPFAFFGHSMGAAIAFAAGLLVRSADGRTASHVFLSGRTPGSGCTNLHRASDSALIAALGALGLTPQAVLAHGAMMQALLPMIRADLTLAETSGPAAGERLNCPLTIFAGRDDPVALAHQMTAWTAFTTAPCRIRHYPGAHFFLFDDAPGIMRAVSEAMRPRPDVPQTFPE